MAFNITEIPPVDDMTTGLTSENDTVSSATDGVFSDLYNGSNINSRPKIVGFTLPMRVQIALLVIMVFVGLLIFVSNISYIIVFWKKQEKPAYTLLLSLCLADLVRAMPIAINRLYVFLSNQTISGQLSVSLRTVVAFSGILSQYHQTAIALDRLLIVFCPIWYQNHVMAKYGKTTAVLLWAITASYFFPIVIYYYIMADLTTIKIPGLPSQILPRRVAFPVLYGQRFALAVFCFLAYICIFWKINKLRRKPVPNENAEAIHLKQQRMKRLSQVAALVTVTYLIPWFSSSIVQMVIPIRWYFKYPQVKILGLVIEQLTFIPAWLNPIVIVIFSPQHRAIFLKALRGVPVGSVQNP